MSGTRLVWGGVGVGGGTLLLMGGGGGGERGLTVSFCLLCLLLPGEATEEDFSVSSQFSRCVKELLMRCFIFCRFRLMLQKDEQTNKQTKKNSEKERSSGLHKKQKEKKQTCPPFHLQWDICANAELNLADVSRVPRRNADAAFP